MNPTVSICIPTYNSQYFIRCCIESILDQSFDDYEVIVVDDKSSDDTCAIVESFNDSRIRLIRNSKNIGMEANWNKSLIYASGAFIKLVCADDIIYPNCIASQVNILQCPKNFDVSLVTGLRDILRENGRVFLASRGLRRISGRLSYGQIIRLIFETGTNPIGEPATVMFRQRDLMKIGFFSARRPYLIDLDFWIRLLRVGMLYVQPATVAGFRMSRSSVTMSMRDSQAEDLGSLLKELFLNNPSVVTTKDYLKARFKSYLNCQLRSILYRFFS